MSRLGTVVASAAVRVPCPTNGDGAASSTPKRAPAACYTIQVDRLQPLPPAAGIIAQQRIGYAVAEDHAAQVDRRWLLQLETVLA